MDGKTWSTLSAIINGLCRHDFKTVQAGRIRIHVKETNGDKLTRIFEVRCYV